MRYKYGGLREEPCSDCVVHWCCSSCANCQGKSADDILLLGHHYALTFQLVRPAEAREIKVCASFGLHLISIRTSTLQQGRCADRIECRVASAAAP